MGMIKYNKKNLRLAAGLILITLAVVPVLISFVIEIYDPNEVNYSEMLKSPSPSHIFGTDDYGRDIYTRVMKGAATTFGISLFTAFTGAFIGTVVGALTGYFGGIIDEVLMRVNDTLASFPSILLALVVVSLIDKGTWNICIALGIVFIPSFARIMRSEYLKEKNKDYVLNARLMGAGHFRVIFVHIFPNTLPILLSSVLVGINNAVLAEAGLSYLGLGVQPPEPSLGRMLSEAKTYLLSAPWYELFPCLHMIMFILGLTLISDNFGVSGVSLFAVKKKIARLLHEEKPDNPVEQGANESGNVPVISVKDLKIGFIEDDGIDETIKGISFDLHKGEVLGVVGESGSGKSLTAMGIMGILPEKAVITGGNIIFEGEKDLTVLDNEEYRKLRGKELAYVFQEPMTSLNPVAKIGTQIDEILDIHASELREDEQKRLVIEALEDVGLEESEKLYNMYPFELSGGMRQRVCIAMALIAKAKVILADEPTTALDAEVADMIIGIFKHINKKYGTSILLISHDLRVIGKMSDRVIVMKDGQIIETIGLLPEGSVSEVSGMERFDGISTDYGKKLLSAAFATRRYTGTDTGTSEKQIMVSVRNLSVFYKLASKKQKGLKKVIENATFEIPEGITAGIVGGSGSGKSTLVKAIAGLQKYVKGEIRLNCSRPCMVFQDPYSSLNPAFKVRRILEEPLRLKEGFGCGIIKKKKSGMLTEIKEMLKETELEEEILDRRVSELSGGQRQRIAIALTLIQRKKLIILDEPVSALDVTIQEQIIELLMKLKEAFGLTYILISHDMRLVSRVCDKIYKISRGVVTEYKSEK